MRRPSVVKARGKDTVRAAKLRGRQRYTAARKLVGVEQVLAGRLLGGLEKYGITGFQCGANTFRKVGKDVAVVKREDNDE